MTFQDSTHKFTDPIRVFKANDPYHYVVDNLPLNQLMENDRWLKDQVESLTNAGSFDRSNFSELKPYVTGSDNVIRVNPGQYHARINDAYNLTIMQKLRLLNSFIPGDIRQYTNENVFDTASFQAIIDRVHSSISTDALNLNGLSERVLQLRIVSPDQSATTGSIGNKPSTGGSSDIDYWPVIYSNPFRKYVRQNYGTFADLQKISAEFVKMYRGVGRIAVVSVDEELTIDVPAFDPNDFRKLLPDGTYEVIPASTRIDLVFIYSHPIDASSTTIHSFSNATTPRTITQPTLGIVRGAGVVLQKLGDNSNISILNLTQFPLDSNSNPQILANAADQNNSDNGFKVRNIHGSFPLPEDLMNIAPNIIEDLESNDLQLIGQSVFPVCYVVVRSSASVNTGGQPVVTDTDIIDIRPFFRTAELTYNERAGILMASPPLSPANPAVGQSQLDWQLNGLLQRVRGEINQSQEELPRVVGGGIIWGGRKFGAEGAIRLAAKNLNAIADSNLPYSEAPILPDWDLADWWTMYAMSESDTGQRRNDRINVYFLGRDLFFDSGTNPTDESVISSALRLIGTENHNYRNSYSVHWCKKEILIDRNAVGWMYDYTVECQLLNCIFQTSRASESGAAHHSDDSGSAGIWVEKKTDRFIVYVAWIADTPRIWNQSSTLHGREPRNDRDTYGFSGFIARTSDMGLPTSVNNIQYNNTAAKAPYMGACTYPTVSFKITAYPVGYFHKTLAQYPQTALIALR